MIRVGIGGWTYEPWRSSFYPEGLAQKRELEYASRRLSTIEINGTFYGSQKPESFQKWHDETPDGFVFALKAPRFATNRRRLADAGESIARFFASGIERLATRLGPVNWQFPAAKAYDPQDFAAFLALLPREVHGRRLRHAVELRHPSFASAQCVEQLRSAGVGVVVAGDSKFPLIADVTADFVYLRLMGTNEADQGYPAPALDAWVERARRWAEGDAPADLAHLAPPAARTPRDVFLYVISGHKPANPATAMALGERLREG